MQVMDGWDGTLSAEEFKGACLFMADVWGRHCSDLPSWHWQSLSVHPLFGPGTPEGYLVLEDVLVEDTQKPEECLCCDAESKHKDIGSTDPATVAPLLPTKGCLYTYHITYSEAFRVPKLFLKGRFLDGQPLQWQDMQLHLPAALNDDRTNWTFLTYEEHPYLHMPWLALHPCGTSSLVKVVFSQPSVEQTSMIWNIAAKSSAENVSGLEHKEDKKKDRYQPLADMDTASVLTIHCYIMTWLSFASQAVGLKLPRHFSKCFTKVRKSENFASNDCPRISHV